jgi:hypothetical protein
MRVEPGHSDAWRRRSSLPGPSGTVSVSGLMG